MIERQKLLLSYNASDVEKTASMQVLVINKEYLLILKKSKILGFSKVHFYTGVKSMLKMARCLRQKPATGFS